MIYGIANNAQFTPLAWSVLLGVFCGVLWDILRFFRYLFPAGRIRLFAEDVLFFVAWALLTFLLCYVTNFGIVRAYILLAQPFGFFLWYFFPGRMTQRIADRILTVTQRIVIRPVLCFFCILYRFYARHKKKKIAKDKKCRKKSKKAKKIF